MNESILDGTGIRLVRTPTGLRVEKEVKENLEENAKQLSEDIDLGPIKLVRTATGLKVLEKADESFNSKDDDKEVLNEYGKYRDEIQVGDKIKIIHLKGEDNRYDGRVGVVTHIDDIGDA
ncbi:MAG: hypothetical protein J6W64_07925 [Bacilli bacterium]|nr:hypothetical protein [Bacilli bacterium]